MRLREHLSILLAFTLLSLALTYPLILHFNTHLAGPYEDNLNSLWNFWWVKTSMWERHIHPYFTDYLFYPTGTSLAFHTLSLANTLPGIPLQAILNPITCYNLMILAGFILSGWSCYVLAHHLTQSRRAAFLAGVIFAFNPYHLAHARHHLNLASTQFIPLYAYCLIRLTDEPELKWSLGAAASIFLAALCCWYYLAYLTIFSIVFGIYLGLARPQIFTPKLWRHIFIFTGAAAALILPFIYPLLKETYYHMPYIAKDLQAEFSADLLAFFTPPPGHFFWDRFSAIKQFYQSLPALEWEAAVYLGYTVLGLAVLGLAKYRRDKSPHLSAFWWICAVVFAALALGPRLHIRGQIWWPWLRLPYTVLHRIPLIGLSSVPSRFVIIVYLSLAVMAAYGTAKILSALSRHVGNVVLAGLMALILLEYTSLPFPVSDPREISRIHLFEPVIRDKDDCAVLELPLYDYFANEVYMYRQTRHRKRLIFGCVSRISVTSMGFIEHSPLIKLAEWESGDRSALSLPYFQQIKPLLLRNNIRYIVLNKYLYSEPAEAAKLEQWLRESFPEPVSRGDDVVIYRVNLNHTG